MTHLGKDLHARMKRFPLLQSWSDEIQPQGERPTNETDAMIWQGKQDRNRYIRSRIEGFLLCLVQQSVILDNPDEYDPGEYALVRAYYCKED